MKKTSMFILCLLVFSIYYDANPIAEPQAIISELYFDQNNNWSLEIGFAYESRYYKKDFDSICVKTSNGFARIKLDNIKDSTSLFVVNSDSLNKPLTIIREGDNITVISFLKQFHHTIKDSLTFGNEPNSSISILPTGYSISRINHNVFSRDKSPTIGLPNDTTGVCGTMQGYIYDKNNNIVKKGNFGFDNLNEIVFSENGKFSTRVFSRKINMKYLANFHQPGGYTSLIITPIELDVAPDSTCEKNIYILSDYIVGVKEKTVNQNYELQITNYPNPFNSTTNFFVKIPVELRSKKGQINIYNSNGQKISSIEVSDKSNVRWHGTDSHGGTVASGIYYYQLVLDNEPYKSGSMILLK
jgi:hypothetical protein